MTVTIGLVANVYNEANALPGWLETHLPFFDDVRIMHASPGGERSDDGTLEILDKWNVPVQFCTIDEGFGVVRTKTLRMSPCDYIMLLDADERFYPVVPLLQCGGEGTPQGEADEILRGYDFRTSYPDWDRIGQLGAGLHVNSVGLHNQGDHLRRILNIEKPDAVATIRRHWHGFGFKRPTQDWRMDCDWQMRVVRNHPSIMFDPSVKMHEALVGVENMYRGDLQYGPFMDHFHFWFKRMEQAQRAHDVAIYDALHKGERVPSWGQHTVNKIQG